MCDYICPFVVLTSATISYVVTAVYYVRLFKQRHEGYNIYCDKLERESIDLRSALRNSDQDNVKLMFKISELNRIIQAKVKVVDKSVGVPE